jgi:hypothetical protein
MRIGAVRVHYVKLVLCGQEAAFASFGRDVNVSDPRTIGRQDWSETVIVFGEFFFGAPVRIDRIDVFEYRCVHRERNCFLAVVHDAKNLMGGVG